MLNYQRVHIWIGLAKMPRDSRLNPMVEIIMFPSERNGELLGDIPIPPIHSRHIQTIFTLCQTWQWTISWWMLSSRSPLSSWTFPSFSHGFAGVNGLVFQGKLVQESPMDFSWENRWFPVDFPLNQSKFMVISQLSRLGPLTNLAQVLQEEPELFREKVQLFPRGESFSLWKPGIEGFHRDLASVAIFWLPS